MPKLAEPLTAARIKTLASEAAVTGRRVVADGRGLVIVIERSGRAAWSVVYRDASGASRRRVIGSYPEMSIAAARARAAEVMTSLSTGDDPFSAEDTGETFATVAAAYIDHAAKGRAASFAGRARSLLADALATFGARPVDDLRPADVLAVIRSTEKRSCVMARQSLATIRRALAFAVAVGLTDANPAEGLQVALSAAPAGGHFAAVTDADEMRTLYRAISTYPGDLVTRSAMTLQALLAVRPSNLREMRWSDIDLDRGVWTIPGDSLKIKGRGSFVVLLPSQAIEILKALHDLTGRGIYALPNRRDHARPIPTSTVNAALGRLGYHGLATPHGMRASFRTICAERLGIAPAVLEAALAHDVDPLRGAYDRTSYTVQRAEALQKWADFLASED